MSKEISGTLVVNEISTDSGVTWKVIICEDTSQINGTSSISEKVTKCGTYSATKPDAVKVTGSGVVVGDLVTAQVSYQQLQILRDAATVVLFRRQNSASGTLSAGEITYAKFSAYITEASETSAVGEVSTFNWGVTSTGTIDWDPAS